MLNTISSIAASLVRISLAAVFSATVLSLAVVPAMAGPRYETINVQFRLVHLSDLDLTKPGDQAELKERVANASRIVCTDLPAKGLDNSGGFQTCYSKAMDHAMTQANMIIAATTHSTLLANTR